MKAEVDAGLLAKAVGTVAKAASTRGSVQVLGGVHITAKNGLLILMCSDMEVSLRTVVSAKVETEGSVLVDVKQLASALKSFDGTLGLDYEEGDNLLVTHERTKLTFPTFHIEDFPKPPFPDPQGEIPAGMLLEAIERVQVAASSDAARPVLSGIRLVVDGQQLMLAATDSYRLAYAKRQLKTKKKAAVEAIVPATALNLLRQLAGRNGTSARAGLGPTIPYGMSDKWFGFQIGPVKELAVRVIDGQFPNVNQLIPDSFPGEIVFNREAALDAVGRIVRLVGSDRSPVRLTAEDGASEVTLDMRGYDSPSVEETLPVKRVSLEPGVFEMGFNAGFLEDGLDCFPDDDLTLHVVSPLRPGFLSNGEDRDNGYLIMPIRMAG
jgi:DNA polymerase-3 subunit beta